MASVKQAEGSLRREAETKQQLLPAKPLPHNLVKQPPPLQTALAKHFERELGDWVVLETKEIQSGGDRVTLIRTNKGVFCARTALLRSAAFRGTPVVQTFGNCGP
ncbi:hypothetical protein FNU76_14895 [Chitinimonas arctica]|uniref:Uncharacterized protein n=1 Tax=Chitinimonas arctica TaxID=2594795 RepID=A0A516SHA9_9NEIS|nr:hypothetical protein [Chitinimonas arctica]QDQ27541.1 hypothetical protein FNU76_14895 [Chitinimonas arctica]